MDVLMPHMLVPIAHERRSSCKQFVGHHGERVLISCGDRMPFPLFWCHVRRGATNNLALTGNHHKFGNTKVSQLQLQSIWILCVIMYEKIGRFHILVDDLSIVCML